MTRFTGKQKKKKTGGDEKNNVYLEFIHVANDFVPKHKIMQDNTAYAAFFPKTNGLRQQNYTKGNLK